MGSSQLSCKNRVQSPASLSVHPKVFLTTRQSETTLVSKSDPFELFYTLQQGNTNDQLACFSWCSCYLLWPNEGLSISLPVCDKSALLILATSLHISVVEHMSLF